MIELVNEKKALEGTSSRGEILDIHGQGMKTPKDVYLEKQLTMIFSTESGQGDGNTWRSESHGVSHLVYFPREDHP